jgi:hypothetical protein
MYSTGFPEFARGEPVEGYEMSSCEIQMFWLRAPRIVEFAAAESQKTRVSNSSYSSLAS